MWEIFAMVVEEGVRQDILQGVDQREGAAMTGGGAPATIREALAWAAARLDGSVAAPAVDAELFLRHVLGCSRALLFAEPERRLDPAAVERFTAFVERRAGGEPLQYLTAVQAFRRLELAVGLGVLVPRPETEVVVGRALAHLLGVEAPVVVDVGTGSAAIALSVATERPDAAVWATDISGEAAAWARRNVAAAGASNVTVVEGDLFGPLPEDLRCCVDLVVANPPYLSEAELAEAEPDVRDHEPALATVAGPTGLEVASRVVAEAPAWLRPGGWLVLETHPGQAERLRALMLARYEVVAIHSDLAGRPRIAEARQPEAS
jgi:release factor glutamine methyltransferase